MWRRWHLFIGGCGAEIQCDGYKTPHFTTIQFVVAIVSMYRLALWLVAYLRWTFGQLSPDWHAVRKAGSGADFLMMIPSMSAIHVSSHRRDEATHGHACICGFHTASG